MHKYYTVHLEGNQSVHVDQRLSLYSSYFNSKLDQKVIHNDSRLHTIDWEWLVLVTKDLICDILLSPTNIRIPKIQLLEQKVKEVIQNGDDWAFDKVSKIINVIVRIGLNEDTANELLYDVLFARLDEENGRVTLERTIEMFKTIKVLENEALINNQTFKNKVLSYITNNNFGYRSNIVNSDKQLF